MLIHNSVIFMIELRRPIKEYRMLAFNNLKSADLWHWLKLLMMVHDNWLSLVRCGTVDLVRLMMQHHLLVPHHVLPVSVLHFTNILLMRRMSWKLHHRIWSSLHRKLLTLGPLILIVYRRRGSALNAHCLRRVGVMRRILVLLGSARHMHLLLVLLMVVLLLQLLTVVSIICGWNQVLANNWRWGGRREVCDLA